MTAIARAPVPVKLLVIEASGMTAVDYSTAGYRGPEIPFDRHRHRSPGGRAGRGLFTSETQDPNWRRAHNVLLPAFSMDAMRGYHPRMLDIATQLMLKWERPNGDDTVHVPADMTRLTLDTSRSATSTTGSKMV